MEPTNWAPEHSDALREHLAKGMSFSEIAKAINTTFNTTYSRNAALGRATRMGLTGEVRSKSPSDDKPAAGQGIGEGRPTEPRMPAFWPVPVFKRVKPKKLRCVEIEPRHLSLIDLEHGDCRYPYGGDEEGEAITFCGHPRRAGSSYCSAHFHLSRIPTPPLECVVSAVWLRVVAAA
jgi:GcrA cell cycle regulator